MTPDDPSWDHDVVISEFIGAFAAREDVYVLNGAEVRRSPLTPDVIRHAVSHHYAISGYMASTDGRTHIGALDFDVDDGKRMAFEVQGLLEQHSIPSMVAESRRGAHLWVTSWDWCEVGLTERALRAALLLATGSEATLLKPDSKIEVFPKRGQYDSVGGLRMPGLAHQKTAKTYPVHMNGLTFTSPTFLDVLENHVLTTPEALRKFAGNGEVSLKEPYPKNLDGWGSTSRRDFGDTPLASEVLQKWGVFNAKPGATVKCPMHDDKHGSLTVFKDDQRVYCGSPGCRLNNSGHGIGSLMLSRME